MPRLPVRVDVVVDRNNLYFQAALGADTHGPHFYHASNPNGLISAPQAVSDVFTQTLPDALRWPPGGQISPLFWDKPMPGGVCRVLLMVSDAQIVARAYVST